MIREVWGWERPCMRHESPRPIEVRVNRRRELGILAGTEKQQLLGQRYKHLCKVHLPAGNS
jgi:hypothetical protein